MRISTELIAAVVNQLAINPCGIHGLSHWARVCANGLRLAETTGADVRVVELFALFHDSRRLTEQADPDHGPRGAVLAEQLRGVAYQLDEQPFQLLLAACRLHTAARTHADATVQTCFDADRLDLGRLGITVDPQFLCTEAARNPETLAWAAGQSAAGIVPDNPIGRALRSLKPLGSCDQAGESERL